MRRLARRKLMAARRRQALQGNTMNNAENKSAQRRYRVVQWATGNVGARALRRAIEHPHIDLVGVYVHSADKVGRDAGDIAGIGRTGVAATNSIEEVIALRPDCVMYMPQYTNLDEVCRLLASGINVVTTRTEFLNPASMNPQVRARIEAACQSGQASIHSTGCSPGFATEALPLLLTSLQRRLDHVSINEFADNSSRNSPQMLFEVMGFGEPPGRPVQGRLDHLRDAFGPSLALVASTVGKPLERIEVRGGLGIARKDTQIAAGLVPAGTVAAMRTIVSGTHQGKPFASFTATWYVSSDVETDDGERWQFRESGWHLLVTGDVPLEVSISYPVAPEDYADMTPGLTAHIPLNTVPYLCEAPPGIRTSVDLPRIIPSFS
jgi:4-hydroxy-tetrahydrodipicolinate reductase